MYGARLPARDTSTGRLPWQAEARRLAQRVGVDPRYLRRLRWVHKAGAVRRSGARLRDHIPFVLAGPEPDNVTFDIANKSELAAWCARVAGAGTSVAEAYVGEPERDPVLAARLREATAGRWLWTKRMPPFGKRLGWYALARILHPGLVVETGVHDGLGSLLLLRALELNAGEGHPGRLISFDINPTAGWLVRSHPLWELRIESSRTGLPAVLGQHPELDMFVYDGWHSYAEERLDLEVAADHLAPGGVLLSDDAQITNALADLCRERRLDYSTFQEAPIEHFHPGSMLGAGRARPLGKPPARA